MKLYCYGAKPYRDDESCSWTPESKQQGMVVAKITARVPTLGAMVVLLDCEAAVQQAMNGMPVSNVPHAAIALSVGADLFSGSESHACLGFISRIKIALVQNFDKSVRYSNCPRTDVQGRKVQLSLARRSPFRLFGRVSRPRLGTTGMIVRTETRAKKII